MSPLERLLSELRKRPVWQVAGVYLAGSWVVLQVMDVLAQNLTLPSAAFPSALILLAVGLPIVVVTSLLQRGVDSGIPAAKGLRRVFTWRNALMGGVIASAAWGTLSSTFYSQAFERYLRGEVLFQLGRYEEAIPWFENISQIGPPEVAFRALAYERLGQIYDELGDAAGARQYHSRFVAMWANADEDLQPRVDIARARVGKLSNETRP